MVSSRACPCPDGITISRILSGLPLCTSFIFPSFLVLRVAQVSWLLSARHHYSDADVLSGRDVAQANVNGQAPGSRSDWETCYLGSGSTPTYAG